jgi:hypothetical protein
MKTKVLKYLIAIGLIISTTCVGLTQELQAVGSGGAYHQSTTSSISWSLGEVVTQTLKAGDYIITQGFQQSKLTLTSVFERPGYISLVNAYPNPTSDFIYLDVDGEVKDLSFAVYDMNGKLLASGKFEENPTRVSFANFGSGIYFVRITKGNLEVNTLKVVKN